MTEGGLSCARCLVFGRAKLRLSHEFRKNLLPRMRLGRSLALPAAKFRVGSRLSHEQWQHVSVVDVLGDLPGHNLLVRFEQV